MNKNTKKILIPSTYSIIFTVILIIFEGLSSTGLAFYEGKAIDVITIGSSNKIMVNKLAITIALCFTVQWLSSVFAPYFQKIMFIKRIEILREEIVKSVLNASVSDIDRFETGDIHLRLTKNLNNINYFFFGHTVYFCSENGYWSKCSFNCIYNKQRISCFRIFFTSVYNYDKCKNK